MQYLRITFGHQLLIGPMSMSTIGDALIDDSNHAFVFVLLGKKLIARIMTMWQRYYSCKITISNSNHDKSSNPIHITFFGILKWCKIALFPFTFLNGVDVSQFETVLWIKRAQGGTMTIWDRPHTNKLLSPFSVHLSPSINIPRTHIVVQHGPINCKNEYSVQHNQKWKQQHEIWFSSSWSNCHVPESKSQIAVQRRPV